MGVVSLQVVRWCEGGTVIAEVYRGCGECTWDWVVRRGDCKWLGVHWVWGVYRGLGGAKGGL